MKADAHNWFFPENQISSTCTAFFGGTRLTGIFLKSRFFGFFTFGMGRGGSVGVPFDRSHRDLSEYMPIVHVLFFMFLAIEGRKWIFLSSKFFEWHFDQKSLLESVDRGLI